MQIQELIGKFNMLWPPRVSAIFSSVWTNAAALTSITSLLFFFRPSTGFSRPQITWIIVLGFAAFLNMFFDYKRSNRERLRAFKSTSKIDKYMRRWIDCDGRVVICSRDLSWVHRENESLELLMKKARNNQLTLVIPKAIALSDELQTVGATVFTYPELDYELKSRFTLIYSGQVGAQVAIGYKHFGKHRIEEFRSGEDGAFHLAEDLIEILRRHALQNTSASGI